MFQTDNRPYAFILSRPAVMTALLAGFALIFATTLLTVYSTRGLAAADQRTTQAEHALLAATEFLTLLGEATAAPALASTIQGRARAELATLAGFLAADPALGPLVTHAQHLAERHFARLVDGAAPSDPEVQHAAAELRAAIATLQRNQFAAVAERAALAADRAQTIHALNVGLIALAAVLAAGVSVALLLRRRDLEGLITVCAWTRRVQWQGQWLSFEDYLAKRFNIYCTHGICEEAAEKMRQEAANTPVILD